MKFWEAMKALEQGKSVRATGWKDLFIVNGNGTFTFQGKWLEEGPEDNAILYDYMEDNWELYEEPEKTYSFMEVVKGLKEGKRFKRTAWGNTFPLETCKSSYEIFMGEDAAKFRLEDFEATDWIEVK